MAVVVAGTLLLASPTALAGCAVVLCTWETGDGDRAPDVAYVGAAGTSASVSSYNTRNDVDVKTVGTTSSSDLWWNDANGDLDPEQAFASTKFASSAAGRPLGAYSVAYFEDYDEGDVVDRVYAMVQVGVDSVGLGASTEIVDEDKDLTTGTRSTSLGSSW